MRLRKLKRKLKLENKIPYLISDLHNIKYLTGFNGTYAYLVIDEKKSYFISDSRYEEHIRSILPGSFKFILQEEELKKTLKSLLNKIGCNRIFVEEHSMPLSTFNELKRGLRGIRLISASNEVNTLRMIKDDLEVTKLKKAASITDKCFNHIIKFIKPGMKEWDIAVEIEFFYKKNGCRSVSFDPIVASGKMSSMPHYETSISKKIKKGDVILIDMGCIYDEYNSDLTRTIFVNSIDPEIEKIYTIVREAQERSISFVKPGITTGKLDSIARNYINDMGYGGRFGHSLGHSLGLEVHEIPAVKKDGETNIKKNMVLTVEPGIYVPNLGGVRIEDMVLVTSRGYDVLTKSSKDIIVI
ncbi:M24 family metallopeptidase [Spirochaetota bacterium]